MKRIQRKRIKGWKMPDNTIYVGRPTKWGNPLWLQGDTIYIDAGYRRKAAFDRWSFFTLGNIDILMYYYRALWEGTELFTPDLQHWSDRFIELDLNELKGKDLACFCPLDAACHADVLLELANKNLKTK